MKNMQLDPEILEAIFTNKDEDLKSLSEQQNVMLVFLRHFGCTFCREALSDVKADLHKFREKGIKIVMVHMATEDVADDYFAQYGLEKLSRISDPDLSLYEYFGLYKGGFWQLYGLKVWWRALASGVVRKHGKPDIDKKLGNVEQMPGIFILRDCQIVNEFVHNSAADRPNYQDVVDAIPQTLPPSTQNV